MSASMRGLVVLVLALFTFGAGVAVAAKDPPKGWITLNFVDADIGSVIEAMSQMTGRTFVVDPRVKGTLKITSPRPVSPSVAYDIVLAALRMQGYAAVQVDGVVRIVPEADAKFYATHAKGKTRGNRVGGEMTTRVFTLRHESASQLLAALRPMIGVSGVVNADPDSNTLIVTDYADNLARLEQVIASMDIPTVDEPVLIPLKYASAGDISALVSRVFMPQGAGASTYDLLQVGVDERSNSLIVRGRDRSLIGKVQNLAASLDVPTPVAGNVHVIYLKNAQAVEVAKTLRNILTGDTTALIQTPAAAQPATAAAQAVNASASRGELGAGMIQADAGSNALIITAPEAIFANIKSVVEKLDVRRAQVLVEALIAEVSEDKAAEFGIQWLYLDGLNSNNTSGLGAFGNSSATSNIGAIASNPATIAQGLNLGLVKGVINVPGVGEIVNLAALARALVTTTNATILATPNLLTLDNEEAKITVGSNVPFATGSYTTPSQGSSADLSPFTTYERKDVGLTLKVKPQISQGGTVRLLISQEISKVRQGGTDPTLATTDKRSLDSTVLVDDGQIIVLGGLIQDAVQEGEDSVPLLGDLPLLGSLFRYTTRSHVRTNLMIFLRPVILRNADDATAVTNPRYDYILGRQKAFTPAHRLMLPDMPATLISEHLDWGNVSPSQDKVPTPAAAPVTPVKP
jgi:general secretion pathway protein D